MNVAFKELCQRAEGAAREHSPIQVDVICPSHEDSTPSLSLGVRTVGDPGATAKCHAGCRTEDVMAAWGLPMAALYDSWWLRRNGHSAVEDTYDYTDERGELLFQVVRKTGKHFLQRRPDGNGGWAWKLGDTRRVLYRLPAVVGAAKAGRVVYVVEGEKDVHALEDVGQVATCNPGGAGKWRAEYAEPLRGARVVVVADRDDPGRKHAQEIAACLAGVAFSAVVVEPTVGKDATDHLAAGHDVGKFVRVARKSESAEPARYAGRHVDLAAMLARPAKPAALRVSGLVADATLTILSGESGSGKSFLAQGLCIGVARGQRVAGMVCVKGKALYIDAEMGKEMFAEYRLRPAGLTGKEFEYIDAMGLDLSKANDLGWIERKISELGADFVVIDSLRRAAPSKKENESDDMAPTVGAFAKLARDTNAAILLIHHKGKGDALARGSSAIYDQADALYGLLRLDDQPRVRRLTTRHGKPPRYMEDPRDRFLTINPRGGGVAAADAPEPDGPKVSVQESVAMGIKAALPATTKKDVAEKLGRPPTDVTFRRAWSQLEAADEIKQVAGVWDRSYYSPTLGAESSNTSPDSAAQSQIGRYYPEPEKGDGNTAGEDPS
jgi:hypothetical protein